MTKETGGPAFPEAFYPTSHSSEPQYRDGMTLRDWFAGQALAGMLAHQTRYKSRPYKSLNWHEAISEEAYELADAMIAERNKP